MIGGRLIGHNDPDYQERVVKFNELIANAAIYSTALDITDAAGGTVAGGTVAGVVLGTAGVVLGTAPRRRLHL